MKLLFDLHTHTLASGHAYSSLKENLEAALEAGLLAYGFSEHAPGFPGSADSLYFFNLGIVPRRYKDMYVFAGIEADIIDYQGNLSVDENLCTYMDYIVASLHTVRITPGSRKENMDALIGAMKNPYVKIIGHPDDARYPLDYRELAEEAKRHAVVLELNNSSLRPTTGRKNGPENIRTLLRHCKEVGVPILCGTDSHIWTDVGRFAESLALLKELDFPEELVVNTRLENLPMVLNRDIWRRPIGKGEAAVKAGVL